MANRYHSGGQSRGKGCSPATMGGKGSAAAAGMKEKPGFPGADLPGKAQTRNRSNGVKSCQVYADSKGI